MIDVAGAQQLCPRRQPEPHYGIEALLPGRRTDIAIDIAPVHWRDRRGVVERTWLVSL